MSVSGLPPTLARMPVGMPRPIRMHMLVPVPVLMPMLMPIPMAMPMPMRMPRPILMHVLVLVLMRAHPATLDPGLTFTAAAGRAHGQLLVEEC